MAPTWLPLSYMRHDSLTHVTWLIHLCDMNYPQKYLVLLHKSKYFDVVKEFLYRSSFHAVSRRSRLRHRVMYCWISKMPPFQVPCLSWITRQEDTTYGSVTLKSQSQEQTVVFKMLGSSKYMEAAYSNLQNIPFLRPVTRVDQFSVNRDSQTSYFPRPKSQSPDSIWQFQFQIS